MKNDLQKILIEIALKVAKEGKGCLLVIEKNPVKYSPLLEQDIKPFSVFEFPRRIQALSTIDGALIISPEGILKNYAVLIEETKAMNGKGARHSAGMTASKNGNTVILASEEDKKVRIFENGIIIMEIDSLSKDIENKVPEAINILESIGAGSLATIGIGVLAPSLGIVPTAGIIVFGSAYYLINLIKKGIKR